MSDIENMSDEELAGLYAKAKSELDQRAEVEEQDDGPDADLNRAIREASRNLGDERNRNLAMRAKTAKLMRLQGRTSESGYIMDPNEET